MAQRGRGNGLLPNPPSKRKPSEKQVEAARSRIEANADNYIRVLEDLSVGVNVVAKLGPDGKFQRQDVFWAIVDGGDHDGERIGVYTEKPDTRAAIVLAEHALGKPKSRSEVDIRTQHAFTGIEVTGNPTPEQLERGREESRVS